MTVSVGTDIQRAASYWDRVAPSPERSRWWQWPRIIALQNERVCGKPLSGWGSGLLSELTRRSGGRVFERGISVACGNGSKEMAFLRAGVVRHFDLFEISETRIAEGRELYEKAGLSDRVTWHVTDGINHMEQGPGYDMVFWDNALHHMPDTTRAVEASRTALSAGGAFVMNDFVGANRFQWTTRELHFASAVRAHLPDGYLRNPRNPATMLARTLSRPNLDKMIGMDPSEAGDSESILPAIGALMPDPAVWFLGGSIYHLALNDVLANMDPDRDAGMLEALLVLELAMIEHGEGHYAAAIAIMP